MRVSKKSRFSKMQRSRQNRIFNSSSNVMPYVISENTLFNKRKRDDQNYVGLPDMLPYYQTKIYSRNQDESTDMGLEHKKQPLVKNTLHLDLPGRQRNIKITQYIGEQMRYEKMWKSLIAKIFSCCMKPVNHNELYQDCDYCDRRVKKPRKARKGEIDKEQLQRIQQSKRRKQKVHDHVWHQNNDDESDDSDRYYKRNKSLWEKCCNKSQSSDSSSQSDSSQSNYGEAPYISQRRIKIRETQPVNTFYQDITNEQIRCNRFQNHIEF